MELVNTGRVKGGSSALYIVNPLAFSETSNKLRLIRSRHRRCSVRKGVLRNFAKFTGKQLYQSLFFNKVAG